MNRRSFALVILGLLVAGCGGGKGLTDKLFVLKPGVQWVYSVTGTVNANSVQAGSTMTVSVPAGTVKDLNGQDVNILDRKFDLIQPDGRHVQANLRLYWSQSATGIYIHGFNFVSGTVIDNNNDVFVPATANPPFQFLYIADPAVDGLAIQYVRPFGPLTATGYKLALGVGRQQIQTPAGVFQAKPIAIDEQFLRTTGPDLSISNGALMPNIGFIGGDVDAVFPSGDELKGQLVLQQFHF